MSRMSLLRLRGGLAVLALAAALVAPPASAAPLAKPRPMLGNFDSRLQPSPAAAARVVFDASVAKARLRSTVSGIAALRSAHPGAKVKVSPITAAPELVSGTRAPLSGADPRPGIDIVRDFIKANSGVYGLTPEEADALTFLGESRSKSGLRMVRVVQPVGGIPIFGSETRFILDRDGRVWRSLGALVPQAIAPSLSPAVSPERALVAALHTVGIDLDPSRVRAVSSGQGPTLATTVGAVDDRLAGDVPTSLLLFPAAPGKLQLAWRQTVFTSGDQDWTLITDAQTGAALWRKNIRANASTQEARFSVYVKADGTTPADSPAPHAPTTVTPGSGTQFPEISRTTVNMSTAQDPVASQNGWIPDGGSTTTGNNVDACVDRIAGAGETNVCDIGTIDNNGRPVGNPDSSSNNRDFLGTTPRDYTYSPAPLGGNPDAGDTPTGTTTTQVNFRRGSVTQMFYDVNWYHDQLYELGFDEAAGNFQTTNFSGQGLGGDAVRADVQDSSGTNNANFATPPDGTPGRCQMYRFTGPNPDRDGALDAEVVLHELTHGVSNRLMGDGDGLQWSVGGGMGEGWSDFVALSLLHSGSGDDPNAEYANGAYATYKLGGLTDNYLYGIRRFPYTTDNTINPMTWAETDDVTANYSGGIAINPLGFEFNGALEVHNVGEIWALTLWEVRSRVIADPAGANGNIATGSHTMLQLVVDAMKMTPANPSYVEARDALILADCATNACANEASIWGGFADRGLGYGAVAPLEEVGFSNFGHMSVGTSFALPNLDVAGTTVDDSLGNNNGAIDPGEPIRLSVSLSNPWHAAAFGAQNATATLTSPTAGVTILNGSASYGAIAAQASTGSTPFLFTLSPSAACGQAIHFTLAITSSLGTVSRDFTLRVGAASGTGAPITYTKTLGSPLAIPDAEPTGVFDTQTITDDFAISDLNFRVDNIQHTFTGDLTVMLRGPNGYGSDLIWLRNALFGGGDGNNFINTVIDDQSSNDLNQSPDTGAPFTGDWLPAFNSPVWNLFGDPGLFPDPVGQLSRYNGASTQGTWTIHVADNFAVDTGTLNAWSLIVTPTAFTCAAFTPTVAVGATKTVAGTFAVGGTVTYTVTLTNNGTATQADNPGHEFTDVLPAGLALVGASATSGTAVATPGTNTVTWDGALPLLGGSVTITITATVTLDASGSTVSNQGSIAFDADANGTNESSGVTDDPSTTPPNDPTSFAVARVPIAAIPALSTVGFTALALLLAGGAILLLRRRRIG